MSRNSLLETGAKSEVLSDCNGTRTHNHLIRKRTLNHLAKLAKWLIVRLRIKWLWVRVPLQSPKKIGTIEYVAKYQSKKQVE